MEPGDGPALIFDIGGGPTELMQVEADGLDVTIHDWISVPWGVVSLTEHALPTADSPPARQARYDQIPDVLSTATSDFPAREALLATTPLCPARLTPPRTQIANRSNTPP